MSITSNVWVIAAPVIVIGFGLGFGQPLSMTMVVQLVPSYARATALAIRLMGNRLGQVAGRAAEGLIAGSAGTKPVFWMSAQRWVRRLRASSARRSSPKRACRTTERRTGAEAKPGT